MMDAWMDEWVDGLTCRKVNAISNGSMTGCMNGMWLDG